ncbi:SusC/RagA family TonB-linked outer membrane protein [Bacteroidota bacterium]
MKRLLFYLLFSVLSISVASAQIRVTGTVTSAEDNASLPGVSVLVKGTQTGTITDIEGFYSLEVEGDDLILEFSFVGMETQEVAIGNQTVIDVALSSAYLNLDEVVVTALGISRDKKALGYAVSVVGNDQLQNKPETDLAASLAGKVAGLNIVKSAGMVGAGSSITIRGMSSINQSNQPLFVIDGVPIDASTNQIGLFSSSGGSNAMFSSRFLDIDPNNIANISVLKGLNASALYGEQGKNGVIIITTKTGSGAAAGLTVDLNQSVYVNQVAKLPDYTNIYGQGGDDAVNVGYVGNWGGRFDDDYTVAHHYDQNRFATVFPEYQGVTVPYEDVPNNVRDFFRNGWSSNTYLGVQNGFEKGNINFNVGYNKENGYIPENTLNKLNLGVGGTFKAKRLSFNGSMNFARTDYSTPPFSALNAANGITILQRLLFIPRNLDLTNLPYQNPVDGSSIYYRTDQENPYWLLGNSRNEALTNRFIANVKAEYSITEKLGLFYQLGIDTYNEAQRYYVNKGGVSSPEAEQGFLRDIIIDNSILNHNFAFDLKRIEIANGLQLSGILGAQVRQDSWKRNGIASSQQIVFNRLQHSNYQTSASIDPVSGASLNRYVGEDQLGIYGQMTLDVKNYAFITFNGRNDWTSTVEKENRSLFYPGVSAVFIPTAAIPGLESNAINMIKLRGAYATSAGFPPPYSTRSTFVLDPAAFNTDAGSAPGISQSNVLGNPNLRPELHTEVEFGIEGFFFNNRIHLEATGYFRKTEDQIILQDLDPASGYFNQYTNLGRVDNKGVEIDLGIVPIHTGGGFEWRMQNLFTLNRSMVVEAEGEIMFAGYTNLGNFAIEGQPLGVIKGNYAATDDEGNYLINFEDGKIIDSEDLGYPIDIIGDPNPDFKVTSINTFSYRGLSLSAQVDYTHGGDFYSVTIESMMRRGVTKDTEDREKTWIIPGVLANPNTGELVLDDNDNSIENTIQLPMNEVVFIDFWDPNGQSIFDGSVVRVREVSLSYNLPKSWFDKIPVSGISLQASGQNLWYYAPNVPEYSNFDPETLSTGVGNGMGLEFGSAPSARKFALTLKATF